MHVFGAAEQKSMIRLHIDSSKVLWPGQEMWATNETQREGLWANELKAWSAGILVAYKGATCTTPCVTYTNFTLHE